MKMTLGLAFAALSVCLCACDSSTSSSNSDASGASVDAAVIGTWKGVSGTDVGDTLTINKDSLTWPGYMGIGPTTLGARFYAKDGKMGLTTGQGTPGVAYEYLISGDTLWMEFQNLSVAPADGVVNRLKSTAFLKIP